MTAYLKSALVASFLLAPIAASAGGENAPGQRENNFGEVTSGAISGGFDQGAHASDPSGDGQGPGTSDEPRDGLANAGGTRGSLSGTMDALGL